MTDLTTMRDAIGVVRDALRERRVVDFRERDELVMTLFRAADALEQAERERDEARAAHQAEAADNTQNVLRLVRAQQDNTRLRALTVWGTAQPVGPLYDEIQNLRALLAEVEWVGVHGPGGGIREDAECLSCHRIRQEGHALDCRLAAALKEE